MFQTFAVGCSVLAQKVLMEGECCCAASSLDASVLSIDSQYDGAPCRYPDTRPRGCASARVRVGRAGDRCTGQYHRPLILGGFAPERTRRRVPQSDRSVGISLT